jgi:uncharacterized protein YkwD
MSIKVFLNSLRILGSAAAILYGSLSSPIAVAADREPPEPLQVQKVRLGPAPEGAGYVDSPVHRGTPRVAGTQKTGDFGMLDLADRHISRAFFSSVYNASEGVPIGWNGDTSTCNAGTTTKEFQDAVLTRVNYYRAMAGVPDQIVFDTTLCSQAQQAALMMSANGTLSHNPPANWACYSQEGAQAASRCNLSWGNNGYDAVTSQMRDNGSNNASVGHRRWLLHPLTQEMGTGDVAGEGNYRKANAIWVVGNPGGPVAQSGAIAWPPSGYVPYPVVFARWSVTYRGASLGNASITMIQDGNPVNIRVEPPPTGSATDTLVWVPHGLDASDSSTSWPRPSEDTTYTIVVSGIDGVDVNQVSYEVTVFDPAESGPDEVLPVIAGDVEVPTGTVTDYTFRTLTWCRHYEWRSLASLTAYEDVLGAEDGGAGIEDGTDPSYPLITRETKASGLYSFHLAHPTPTRQHFALTEELLIEGNAELLFESRLGWAAQGQIARLQLSLDGGCSWFDKQTWEGNGDAGEIAFSSRRIPLTEYENRTIHVRFVYDCTGTQYYPQTDNGVGFYVDDIRFLGAQEVGEETLRQTEGPDHFLFSAAEEGDYGLQVRATPWSGFGGLEWGPLLRVVASETLYSRGDCDGNSETNLTDAMFLLLHLFMGGNPPDCARACDVDGNHELALTDAVGLLNYLFLGGSALQPPFGACGRDPTDSPLTCESFVPCE